MFFRCCAFFCSIGVQVLPCGPWTVRHGPRRREQARTDEHEASAGRLCGLVGISN